jgi:hypothetical protein
MLHTGSRTITLERLKLIDKITENKANHIKEYDKAVIDYKAEALKQLAEQTQNAKNGNIDIKLNLISPVDNSKNYDRILEMFTWDVQDIVELDQDEFLEYVQDETTHARESRFANTLYYSGT